MKEEEVAVVPGEEGTSVEGDGWVVGPAVRGVSKRKSTSNRACFEK